MYPFQLDKLTSYHDLPLSELNSIDHSVYLINFDWTYIFINDFVKKNLGQRAIGVEGKNMWEVFAELHRDPSFMQMKKEMDERNDFQFVVTSPVTGHRLHVKGFTLKDCFFFSSAVLPRKEDLIDELRIQLQKKSSKSLSKGNSK